MALSETLIWRARAGQARRVAGMLSQRDAALLEAYARECEDRARAAFSFENARLTSDTSVESGKDGLTLRASAKSRSLGQAA
jgi:hypothetical protein